MGLGALLKSELEAALAVLAELDLAAPAILVELKLMSGLDVHPQKMQVDRK